MKLKVKVKVVFEFPNKKFKGVWWMPWLEIAMKDVAWRRYASGRCLATFDPEMSEWGNPSRLREILMLVIKELTWGSKTFQYPEENKTMFVRTIFR